MRLTFEKLWQRSAVLAALVLLAVLLLIPGASVIHSQAPAPGKPIPRDFKGGAGPALSGAFAFKDLDLGTGITECPQAGLFGGRGDDDNHGEAGRPTPLDRREIDEVEQLSNQGDDKRVNQDFSCFPQDEVSVDTNPGTSRNFVVGMNDYRLGTGSSGFSATTDGGKSFYDGIIPFPSGPASQTRGEGLVPSGGDPIIFYDSAGIVYYGHIGFFRGDDTNGVFVSRSTNGGFTWTRACIPIDTTPTNPNDDASVCGGAGDARQPGDGRVTFNRDPNGIPDGSVPIDDKPYATAGPRPAGVSPVCFNPITRTPTGCNQAVVGADRLYVTFTRFTATASQIVMSYSDDQARSWSPPRPINGSAGFCVFAVASPTACDDNQYSVPTVNPETGFLYVAFENFNTPDENQYLVVRSHDGGQTFQGPFHVTPVFDLNFPRSAVQRPDCTPRGQQNFRIVYTNSCFRSNPGGNIVVDKRGGAFADNLYLVMSDNRNGTTASSNADIFLFKSNDGGSTWIGPTRVNNDRSSLGSVSRDCRRPPGSIGFTGPTDPACAGDFGNDQWWPWVDIGERGELNIVMKDRRLDTNSQEHEWPASRQRRGNYLVWTWGAQCLVSRADSRECLAPGAAVIPQPTAPVNPGPDPVPGQGNQFVGSFSNFRITDVPSNYDYSFRGGIFAGDYENVAVFDSGTDDDGHHFGKQGDDGDHGSGGTQAVAVFTDARNGRSSRNQAGRNPICEQSDVFFDIFDAANARSGGSTVNITPFLVTPCPAAAIEPRGHHDEEDR
jgi:hypothetical protein